MKIVIAFILLSVFTTKGCHKQSFPPSSTAPDISGTWELRSRKGGNIMNADFPAGNGNLIKFSADKYEVWTNNELSNSGIYEIVKDTAGNCFIVYQGSSTSKDTIILEGDQLTLKPSHPDFASRIYKRISTTSNAIK